MSRGFNSEAVDGTVNRLGVNPRVILLGFL